jgi:WD40 repeat protein
MDAAFLPDNKRVISHSMDRTIRIWDISAVIEGREFEVEMDEGMPSVMGSWFRHAIPVGGWYYDQPFIVQPRFKLPDGVKPLDWNIVPDSKEEIGGDEQLYPDRQDSVV